ncbi:hypothetical protein SAMN05444851_2088 [Aliiroseovarius sediminilitoris]|uniref:DUF4177 domain-containing protein n=1 Tax=Aliiroseovarius sediminilitoris TaxID=1173584 RepID=A0A1I0Q021_9RHOB|nr:hypothetical protein [Aliiroseovarius sediminilitoris]SEW20194.1 hypothetical protein SAMN05444851_2088 [Aliiroseovarius sediminilitoris]
MTQFEYEAIPAPRKGKKARGIKTSEDRFANAVTELLNDMAADGWEYLRADTLPSEERSGFTGRTTVYQNILVFRRALVLDETVEAEIAEAQGTPVRRAPSIAAPIDAADSHKAPSLPSAEEANTVSERAPAISRQET